MVAAPGATMGFKPKDQGHAQDLPETQDETLHIPWFQSSFDMLILQSARSVNHLRLINLSLYIHTWDLSYPRATLPVLIADLQGSALYNCIGNDCCRGGLQG